MPPKIISPPPPPPPAPQPKPPPPGSRGKLRSVTQLNKKGAMSMQEALQSGVKLRKKIKDTFDIRNLQCVETTGGKFKTMEECEDVLFEIKATDTLMAILNIIDPQYRAALLKYESKLQEAQKSNKKERKQKLTEEAKAIGTSVAEMETEFKAALPTDRKKLKSLTAAIKKSGGVESLNEFREIFKESTGDTLKLPTRLQSSASSIESSTPSFEKPISSERKPQMKQSPQPSPISTVPARSAQIPYDKQQNVVVNIYNNIAKEAPTLLKSSPTSSKRKKKYCVNCPPLPPPGKKRKLDSFIKTADGIHHRLYMGSRGALYVKHKNSSVFKSLGIKSKELV